MPSFIPSRAEKLTDRVTLDTVIAVLEHYFDLSADAGSTSKAPKWARKRHYNLTMSH